MVDLSKLDFSSEQGLWASIKRVYKNHPVEVQAATFRDMRKHVNWDPKVLDNCFRSHLSKDYVPIEQRQKPIQS